VLGLGGKVRVVVFDDVSDGSFAIKSVLDATPGLECVAEFSTANHHLSQFEAVHPDVALIVVDIENADNTALVERLSVNYPRVATIVLSQHKDWHFVRQYMRAGAKDYLYLPVPSEVLQTTIFEVYRMNKAVHQVVADTAALELNGGPAARVLTFCSRKGGVGKTTLAVNLAVSLAHQGKRVALVDFAQSSLMINEMLNLVPNRTLADFAHDEEAVHLPIESYLTFHEPTGLSVFCSGEPLDDTSRVTPLIGMRVIQSLRERFEYVIVDTASFADEFLWEVLRQSTECWLVNTSSVITVKENYTFAQQAASQGFGNLFKAIFNCADKRPGVTAEFVEQTLNMPIVWQFNCDADLLERSIVERLPFVLYDAHHPLANQMNGLARMLLDDPRSRS